jgi:hypothetical protein
LASQIELIEATASSGRKFNYAIRALQVRVAKERMLRCGKRWRHVCEMSEEKTAWAYKSVKPLDIPKDTAISTSLEDWDDGDPTPAILCGRSG